MLSLARGCPRLKWIHTVISSIKLNAAADAVADKHAADLSGSLRNVDQVMSDSRREMATYLIARRIAAMEQHCWSNHDSKRPSLHSDIGTAESRIAAISEGLETGKVAVPQSAEHQKGKHSLYITESGWTR